MEGRSSVVSYREEALTQHTDGRVVAGGARGARRRRRGGVGAGGAESARGGACGDGARW